MKKATEDVKQPNSIIILGPPGTGKTTLACQFPGVFLLNCDQNIAGPIKYLRENSKSLEFYHETPFQMPDGSPTPRAQLFQRCAELLMEANEMKDVKTLVVDSLTSFVSIVLVEVLCQQGRKLGSFDFKTSTSKTADEQMQIQDWGVFLGLLREFIFRLKATGKTIIFTGHLRTEKDSLTQMLRQFIAVPGQMAETIAGYFGEVWLLENSTKLVGTKREQQRLITTFPMSVTDAPLGLKSSSGIESGSSVDAEEIIKKVCG